MHKERLAIHSRDMHLDILCNEGVHEEEREGEGEGVVSVSSVGSTACLYQETTTNNTLFALEVHAAYLKADYEGIA